MERLNRVLEVDPVSRAARIQAGALGPELAAQLKPHGLALRYFPQSYEFSSLGGWIVTRAGGHYATQYTHIDDFVESTRLVTPSGLIQTRRLPGSGAGPAPDRLVLGSEGTLGVLTEAWVRLQVPPRFRASASLRFGDYFAAAANCPHALGQSGLNPSNSRLLDAEEAVFAGAGDGKTAILVGKQDGDDRRTTLTSLACMATISHRRQCPTRGWTRWGGLACHEMGGQGRRSGRSRGFHG